jgi:nucleotide-binding universal stress UspA family protein
MKNSEEATLGITAQERILYVTDFAEDDREAIDGFSRLASGRHASLEVVHVVDIEHSPSSPDAHMGAQFRLDMLARQLKGLGRNVVSVMLFGKVEDVICRRANEIKATVIAVAYSTKRSTRARDKLVKRIQLNVACPVVTVPGRPG